MSAPPAVEDPVGCTAAEVSTYLTTVSELTRQLEYLQQAMTSLNPSPKDTAEVALLLKYCAGIKAAFEKHPQGMEAAEHEMQKFKLETVEKRTNFVFEKLRVQPLPKHVVVVPNKTKA